MHEVYRSTTTGEHGVLDASGRFSWVSATERRVALDALAKGTPYECEDGEPIKDEAFWDDMIQVEA